MAIRIANIKVGGKKVFNEHQLAVARQIEAFLANHDIVGDVKISRYYSDRWYDLEKYAQILEDEGGSSTGS